MYAIDLTEITYRFTNCGSRSHDGPRVGQTCRRFYENVDSPIVATGERFFQFEDFDGEYDGAQGFRLPRNDIYNITLVGARGGEGLCNFQYGKGIGVKLQVKLTTDYEYLIMVGHRGTSVCEVEKNAANPICQEPRPTTLEEAQTCDDSWYNYTRTVFSPDDQYAFNGGGGGGGASMIWGRTDNTKQFTRLPIALAAGGGGASAILDYNYIADLARIEDLFSIPDETRASNVSLYNNHVNGHFDQYLLNWSFGNRGYRLPGISDGIVIPLSGSGSGWVKVFELQLLPVDGKLLSQELNFAEGGSECFTFDQAVFSNVFGGYGGGGGGCGSGGGGGGYTGGHVFNNNNRMSGSGGDSFVFVNTNSTNNISISVQDVLEIFLNDDDGYVEIVASNCECAGQCEVFTEERQFECHCPNGSLLAPDGSNCYKGERLRILAHA